MKKNCYFDIFQIIINMKVKRKIFLITVFLFYPLYNLTAQNIGELMPPPPPAEFPKSFHGRRVPENHGPFSLLGLKIYTSFEDEDSVFIELAFNYGINPETVSEDCFIITDKNDNPIPIKQNSIYFRKNIQGIKFSITTKEDNLNIKIRNICSFDNQIMRNIEINSVEINAQYHYSRKEGIWKKF